MLGYPGPYMAIQQGTSGQTADKPSITARQPSDRVRSVDTWAVTVSQYNCYQGMNRCVSIPDPLNRAGRKQDRYIIYNTISFFFYYTLIK